MADAEAKNKILLYLKRKNHCVLSTINTGGKPESAIMGYAARDDLSLVLSTDTTSRKYQNLKRSQLISIVFGFGSREPMDENITIQYEGTAKIVEKSNMIEFTKCAMLYLKRIPGFAEFEKLPTTVMVNVNPVWIRWSVFSKNPPEIIETTF